MARDSSIYLRIHHVKTLDDERAICGKKRTLIKFDTNLKEVTCKACLRFQKVAYREVVRYHPIHTKVHYVTDHNQKTTPCGYDIRHIKYDTNEKYVTCIKCLDYLGIEDKVLSDPHAIKVHIRTYDRTVYDDTHIRSHISTVLPEIQYYNKTICGKNVDKVSCSIHLPQITCKTCLRIFMSKSTQLHANYHKGPPMAERYLKIHFVKNPNQEKAECGRKLGKLKYETDPKHVNCKKCLYFMELE